MYMQMNERIRHRPQFPPRALADVVPGRLVRHAADVSASWSAAGQSVGGHAGCCRQDGLDVPQPGDADRHQELRQRRRLPHLRRHDRRDRQPLSRHRPTAPSAPLTSPGTAAVQLLVIAPLVTDGRIDLALNLPVLAGFSLLMSWTAIRLGALLFAIGWHAGPFPHHLTLLQRRRNDQVPSHRLALRPEPE